MPPYFFLATKLENDDATSLEIIRSCMRLGSNMLIEDLFALKVRHGFTFLDPAIQVQIRHSRCFDFFEWFISQDR